MSTENPTQQTPVATESVAPAAPAASTPPKTDVPKPGEPGGTFKSEESKNAVLADLKREREARQALEAKVTQFESSTAERNKALALALGLTEPPKADDDLAATVQSIQKDLADTRLENLRLTVADEHKIPEAYRNLLTETEPEKLKAQAETVGVLVAAQSAAAAPPGFQPNPGQGQGGAGGSSDDEYAKYFPTPNRK